jgi:Na+-driven multidrug efflux pump
VKPQATALRGARSDATRLVASLVSLLPGFAFPLLLSATLSAANSDRFLLPMSVAVMLTNILGGSIEAHTAAQVARFRSHFGALPPRYIIRRYRARVMLLTAPVVLIIGPAIGLMYSLRASDKGDYWTLLIVLLALPLVSAVTSTHSGAAIASGRVITAVVAQSFRMLVPTLVLAVGFSRLLPLALALILGETARLGLLVVKLRKEPRLETPAHERLQVSGIAWQSLSTAVAQTGPVTDRAFLAGDEAGSITAYELSDKFFFAAAQLINYGLTLARVAAWGRMGSLAYTAARSEVITDLKRNIGFSSVVGTAGAATLIVGRWIPFLPTNWRVGMLWGAVLLLGLPATVASNMSVRLLILGALGRTTLIFASINVASNAVFDYVLFTIIGPIGVPLATLMVRIIAGFFYTFYVMRNLERIHSYTRIGATKAST